MKNKFRSLPIIASALIASYAGVSNADMGMDFDQIDYYVALDGQFSSVSLRPVWDNLFKSNAFGMDAAIGMRPSQYYGLELGLQWTTRKTNTYTLANNGTLGGLTNNSGGNLSIESKLRMISTNLDLNGYLPIKDSWEALAYVGVGWARYKPKFILSAAGTNFDTLHSLKAKTRSYFRIGAGFQGLVTDTVGIRFKAGYNAVSKVKFRNKDPQNTANDSIAKGGYTIGLGAYFYV